MYCATCEGTYPEGDRCPKDGARLVRLSNRDPLIGREIEGRYTITNRLGQGGMGAVYRGIQHSFAREVAIKVMNATAGTNPEMIKRFLREAKLASRLAHPNAVAVLDCGETDDNIFYLVMELITGRTLADVLAEEKIFSPERLVRIGTQICEALESAHALSIVHRDLKPTNIMVLSRGRDVIKILDFGLAKSLAPEPAARTMTGIGNVMGTPEFMPPELATGQPCDGRADLYSLGCILFLLGTGRLPFQSDSVNELIAMHGADVAPPMTGVPPALGRIVDRLLAKSPDARFQTATETREALERCLEEIAPQVPPAALGPRLAEPPARRSGWFPVAVLGCLAGAGAAGAAALVPSLPSVLLPAGGGVLGLSVLAAALLAKKRPAGPPTVVPEPAPPVAVPPPVAPRGSGLAAPPVRAITPSVVPVGPSSIAPTDPMIAPMVAPVVMPPSAAPEPLPARGTPAPARPSAAGAIEVADVASVDVSLSGVVDAIAVESVSAAVVSAPVAAASEPSTPIAVAAVEPPADPPVVPAPRAVKKDKRLSTPQGTVIGHAPAGPGPVIPLRPSSPRTFTPVPTPARPIPVVPLEPVASAEAPAEVVVAPPPASAPLPAPPSVPTPAPAPTTAAQAAATLGGPRTRTAPQAAKVPHDAKAPAPTAGPKVGRGSGPIAAKPIMPTDDEVSSIELGPPGAPAPKAPPPREAPLELGHAVPAALAAASSPPSEPPPDEEGAVRTQVVAAPPPPAPPPPTPILAADPETARTTDEQAAQPAAVEPPPVVARTPTIEPEDLPGEPTSVTPMDLVVEPTAVSAMDFPGRAPTQGERTKTDLQRAPSASEGTVSAAQRAALEKAALGLEATAVATIPTPDPDATPAAPKRPIPPGAVRLSHYVVEGKVGRNWSGPIVRAFDADHDRDVHIETLPASLDLIVGTALIAAVAKLHHVNLVRVYELVVHAGKPYLVTEPLTGRTLDRHIAERGEIPWLEAVGLIDELCAGLETAHERGIVHRAVRPACVVIEGKIVKLGGFASAPELLNRDCVAPEVIAGGKPDRRSDIYGVGATLYQCLTGNAPAAGGELQLEKVPEKLRELVTAMLATAPAGRPTSLKEIRARFKTLVED